MSAPDYRIRFDPTTIDFADDVGTTGQDHDSYPAPGTQARYDWMRMYLIGLLSLQASNEAPTQYRNGTLWFKLDENAIYIRKEDEWVLIADAIVDADGNTLTDLFTRVSTLEGAVAALQA